MAALALQPFIPVEQLLRDPLAVAERNPLTCCKVYYGAVSTLGVLIWSAAAACCLFAALVIWRRGAASAVLPFLLFGGLLTGLLALDDQFLVHENILPAFGLPEAAAYSLYAVLGLALLGCGRRIFMHSNWPLFVIAGGLLASSILIDQIFHNDERWRLLLEDGVKFAGIIAWSTFFITTSLALIERAYAADDREAE